MPAVGELEAPDAVRARVRERALDVAEELALEDALRDPARVQRDERPRRAARGGVERAGDDALARAVLARDEDVRVRGPDPRDELEDRPHRRRLRDHRTGRRVSWRRIRFSASRRCPCRSARPSAIWVRSVAIRRGVVPRLLDEVARAAAHRLDGEVDGAPRRHDDDGQRRVDLLDPAEQIEPLLRRTSCRARSSGPSGRRRTRPRSSAARSAAGEDDGLALEALALEQQAQRLEDVRLVVRDEDRGAVERMAVSLTEGPRPRRLSPPGAATIGSTRVARRAGIAVARNETPAMTATSAPNVSGSVGLTSKRSAPRLRVTTSAPTIPRTIPAAVSRTPRRATSAEDVARAGRRASAGFRSRGAARRRAATGLRRRRATREAERPSRRP